MKLLFIRHGDPDYSIDSLTEKGWREANYLSEKISKLDVTAFYVSPLGRAKDTANCTLKKINREGIEMEWLREFDVRIVRPDLGGRTHVAWDWLPEEWLAKEEYLDKDAWHTPEVLSKWEIKKEYDWVIDSFDKLLAKHGYKREGKYYRAEVSNNDTLVFFCHFGVEGVLLSHLLHISPMILWHSFCAAPTSVTTVVTEERQQGIASFRMLSYANTEHLYVKEEEPAFIGRFCECYTNLDQRHAVFED